MVQISQNENHLEAATIHFNEQISFYGHQILINLVRKMALIKYINFKVNTFNNNNFKRLIIEV